MYLFSLVHFKDTIKNFYYALQISGIVNRAKIRKSKPLQILYRWKWFEIHSTSENYCIESQWVNNFAAIFQIKYGEKSLNLIVVLNTII